MLISKLTLIAALSLTAAAYPASRADPSPLDTPQSLPPVGNDHPNPAPGSPLTGQRRPNKHPSRRHEGHDSRFPTPSQGTPSNPDRAELPQEDRSGESERPDGRPDGRPKGGHGHGHDHLRDHDRPGMEGEGRPAGRPSKPNEATPTRMPSGSGAVSEPTPAASLGPKMPTAPAY